MIDTTGQDSLDFWNNIKLQEKEEKLQLQKELELSKDGLPYINPNANNGYNDPIKEPKMTKEDLEAEHDIQYAIKLREAVANNHWDTVETLLFNSNLNTAKIALYASVVTTHFLAAGQGGILAEFFDFMYRISDKLQGNS